MPSTDSPAQALLPFGERNLDFPRRLSPVLQHHNQEPIIVVECDAKGMDFGALQNLPSSALQK
jgi:hypothetical protein